MSRVGRFAKTVGLAVSIWSLAFVAGVVLQGCSSEGPTRPDDPIVSSQPPAPSAEPAPGATPRPVTGAPENPDHDAYVKGGFYHVKNTTGTRAFYCAAAFGVLPGGEQGAGTYLDGSQNQGERNNGDSFEGQAPKKAACQFKQIQVDLTQSKDCRNFDWHNVLAAEVYSNPDFVEGSLKDRLEDEVTFTPWSGQSQESGIEAETVTPECGTRKKITWKVEKYRCSGQIVKTILTEVTETKSCCVDEPRAGVSGPSYPTYTPAKPKVPAYYWYNGENDGIKNDCEAEGGTYFASVDIPPPGGGSKSDVCKTTVNHGSDWEYDNNDHADREAIEPEVPAVPASGGNPLSAQVTFYNSGEWKACLQATSSTGEYNANNPDYDCVKASVTSTQVCGGQVTKGLSYNWIGHDSEYWWVEVTRNGAFFSKTAYVTNPSN